MRVHRAVCISVLLGIVLVAQARAAEFNLTVSAVSAVPFGDFAKKTGIVEATSDSTYSAVGGAAESGFGFNVEIDVRVVPRVFVGGEFGYSRHNADATDLVENGLSDLAPFVKNLDATWTFSSLGCFARVIALDTPVFGLYGRVGIGVAKVKNSFDVVLDVPLMGEAQFTSDFDLGNVLYLTGGVGGEFKVAGWASLVGELRLRHVNTDGAKATAAFSTYEITGTQNFQTQTFDIVIGLRFPLSGI
jgi:hypothetical protein